MNLGAVRYSSFTTTSKDGQRDLTGYVGVYQDSTGTWMRITINGVIRCYEQIAAPGE